MSKELQAKTERLRLAGMNKVPDRVPITCQCETFAYGYAGVTIDEVNKNPLKGVMAFKKVYEELYADAFFEGFFNHPFAFFEPLGADSYFASADGYTAQHAEIAPMEPEEYGALADDPLNFFLNTINPRKFPNLNGPEEEIRKTVTSALGGLMKMGIGMMGQGMLLPNMVDTPGYVGGVVENPFDNFFDYLRGFKGSMLDMRRRGDVVEATVNAIFEKHTIDCEKFYSMLNVMDNPAGLIHNAKCAFVTDGDPVCNPFPWFFNPTHAPAFLSPKQYERFYWPTYKKTVELVHSWGGIVCSLLEGTWGEEKLEFFNELEPGSIILYAEGDDLIKLKKQCGDRQAIMGGMPINILRECSKRECIDYAKRIVDECAPGGGFIFTTDKSLLTVSDVNFDNLKAVNEFVHVYGQY